MKIALGFFGITRSLKFTMPSIRKNILQVLEKHNIQYDIYIHTFFLHEYSNIRTGESDSTHIDNSEFQLLSPNYFIQEGQDNVMKALNLSAYRTMPDPWNTQYQSVDFFILACYSRMQLTKMIHCRKDDYQYVLFLRPDCWYIKPFDIKWLSLATHTSMVIPNFDLYGKYKINDRFAITTSANSGMYGKIFEHLLELSRTQELHSETIFGYILIQHFKLQIIRVSFHFARVRMDGKVHDKIYFKRQRVQYLKLLKQGRAKQR